jgi:hypothetical protein
VPTVVVNGNILAAAAVPLLRDAVMNAQQGGALTAEKSALATARSAPEVLAALTVRAPQMRSR